MPVLRNFRHMLRYARPYAGYYLVGTVALVLVNLLDTFTPKLVQWGIDHLKDVSQGHEVASPLLAVLPDAWFAEGAYLRGVWVYGVLYVLVVATTGVFRYPMLLGFVRATVRLTHDLRGKLFHHLQHLDARWHDRSKVGEHMGLATNDTDAVRMFFGIGLLILADTILYFLIVPLYMASISWKLMLMSSATLPLIPLIVARLTHTVERRYEAVQEQFATVSERSRESFAGAKVVKSFAREDSEVRSFGRQCETYRKRFMSFARVYAVEHPSLLLMLGLADLVVIFFGGAMVVRGEITIGQFTAFFQYLIRLSGPMIGLGWTLMLYQRGHASMRRIEKVLEVEPQIVEPADPAPVRDLRGEIEIRGLTFSFLDDGDAVLRDLDVRVPAGGRWASSDRWDAGRPRSST
jgi:ATP-binding cassette subfamily B multidrug efflux pump